MLYPPFHIILIYLLFSVQNQGMGQSITCNCLENMELDPSSRGKAALERLDVLKKGNKFTRNALLGRKLVFSMNALLPL